MTEDDRQPGPGLKRITGATVLILLAVLLFFVGQPGAPESPQMSASRIAILAPSWARVEVRVTYNGSNSSGTQQIAVQANDCVDFFNQFEASECLDGEQIGDSPTSIPIAIELKNDARISDPTVSNQGVPTPAPLEVVESGDGYQIYLTELHDLSEILSVTGIPYQASVRSDNARYAFISPGIRIAKCGPNANFSLNNLRESVRRGGGDYETLSQQCSEPPPPPARPDDIFEESMRLDVGGSLSDITPLRVDDARPEQLKTSTPAALGPGIEWEAPADQLYELRGFVARANYVDINDESRGQSYTFLSGILVGLATAILPPGFEQLYGYLRGRYRTRPE